MDNVEIWEQLKKKVKDTETTFAGLGIHSATARLRKIKDDYDSPIAHVYALAISIERSWIIQVYLPNIQGLQFLQNFVKP
jgi:hypothetical protein